MSDKCPNLTHVHEELRDADPYEPGKVDGVGIVVAVAAAAEAIIIIVIVVVVVVAILRVGRVEEDQEKAER